MSKNNKVLNAALLLIVVNVVSKTVGFVREMFVAAQFGTSISADIFVAVSTVPNLLLNLTGGALSAALIPIIIRLRTQKEDLRLKQLMGSVFSLTGLLMTGFALLLYIFIEEIADYYVVGFSPEARMLTIEMFKIILPALVGIGLVSFFAAVLNAYEHFFVPSIGPIFYSTGIIIAAAFFAKTFGVKSLAVGMTAGVILEVLLGLTIALKKGIRFAPRIWWNSDLKEVGYLIVPILISLGVFQVNTLVDRMFASTLQEGSLAALNYAYRVTQLPLSLFVGSMVVPLFPMFSKKVSASDMEGLKDLLARSYHILGILLLPVVAIFIVLPEPLIAVLFQRGEFGSRAVELTGLALATYSLMILPFAMRDVITRVMYSMKDTWTPVINSVIMVLLNITLMALLVPRLGMVGITASVAISTTFAFLRLRHKLVKKIGVVETKAQKIWLAILGNTAVFSAGAWLLYRALMLVWTEPVGLDLWLRTFVSLGASGILYVLLTLRLKAPEVEWIKKRLGLDRLKG